MLPRVVAIVLLTASVSFAISEKELPPRYRQWLTRDVVYLITVEERRAFLTTPIRA